MQRVLRSRLLRITVALCLGGALQFGRASLGVPRGLRATYFPNADRAGSPEPSVLDANISTSQIRRNWRGAAPEQFSAQWSGFVTIVRAGTYTFALTSDDASSLSIDGQQVIDLPGRHGPVTQLAKVRLESGPHPIALAFAQYGGGYTLDLQWARGAARLTPVPSWTLAPKRLKLQSTLVSRAFEIAAIAAFLAAAMLAGLAALSAARRVWRSERKVGRIARDGPCGDPGESPSSLAPAPKWAALGLFVALAVIHTWPLATSPAHLSRNDNGDTILNEWIVAWVAHQLPRDPRHLFDANIFYPESDTLAYSESMVVQSVLGAPVLWLGGSPVLAYNLLVLSGFSLTGWSMCLLMRHWTGSWVAGFVSGAIYGFNAHTLTRLPHLQALHVEFLPPALLVLNQLLARPRARRSVALALWFTLQALTSVHLFVFSGFALAAAAVVRPETWWGIDRRRVACALAGAVALSGLALLPFLWPYWRVSQAQHFRRSLEVVSAHSATWQDYLSTPARLHYALWSHQYFSGTALFPGALAVGLAGVAIVRGVAFSNPRARMCLAIAVTGVALSFGPKLPGYAALYAVLPPLQAIRAVVRFGYLGIVGVAGLAGFGVLVLRSWISPRRWPAVAFALAAIAAFESLAAPLGLAPFDGVPAIYAAVGREPRAVVVEIPFYDSRSAGFHAPYMLNSTAHWQPMLNGYSGFQPASFHQVAEALRGFPDSTALEALRSRGVTYAFVHVDRLAPDQVAALHRSASLTRLRTEGSIELYRLEG